MKILCWKGWMGIAVLAAILAVLPFSGTSKAETTYSASAMNPKVEMVGFHAEWCPKCRKMKPAEAETMKWVINEKKPIKMIKFDFTDKATTAASANLAKKEGLAQVFKNNEGKTGFVYLLNANNHKLISTIKFTDTAAQMQSKINSAIAAVDRSTK